MKKQNYNNFINYIKTVKWNNELFEFDIETKGIISDIVKNSHTYNKEKWDTICNYAQRQKIILYACAINEHFPINRILELFQSPVLTEEITILLLQKKGISKQDTETIIQSSNVDIAEYFRTMYYFTNTEYEKEINPYVIDYYMQSVEMTKEVGNYPLSLCSDKQAKYFCDKFINKLNETQLTILCNNARVSDNFRNKLYEFGVDDFSILRPTSNMIETKLKTIISTLFEIEPNNYNEDTKYDAIEELKCMIYENELNEKKEIDIMKKLIEKYKNEEDNKEWFELIALLLQCTKYPNLLNVCEDLSPLNYSKCGMEYITKNMNCTEENMELWCYKMLLDEKQGYDTVSSPDIRKKVLFYVSEYGVIKEFVFSKVLEMLMESKNENRALDIYLGMVEKLVRNPQTPQNVLEKIKTTNINSKILKTNEINKEMLKETKIYNKYKKDLIFADINLKLKHQIGKELCAYVLKMDDNLSKCNSDKYFGIFHKSYIDVVPDEKEKEIIIKTLKEIKQPFINDMITVLNENFEKENREKAYLELKNSNLVDVKRVINDIEISFDYSLSEYVKKTPILEFAKDISNLSYIGKERIRKITRKDIIEEIENEMKDKHVKTSKLAVMYGLYKNIDTYVEIYNLATTLKEKEKEENADIYDIRKEEIITER